MPGRLLNRAGEIMIEYKVGMRVRDRYDRQYLGEVVEVVGDDLILVRWDNEPQEFGRHDPYEISPFDPQGDKIAAQKAQIKVDEACDHLEEAFKAWQEAQEIIVGHSDEGAATELEPAGVDVSKFEGIVERVGWSTSSLYC